MFYLTADGAAVIFETPCHTFLVDAEGKIVLVSNTTNEVTLFDSAGVLIRRISNRPADDFLPWSKSLIDKDGFLVTACRTSQSSDATTVRFSFLSDEPEIK